MPNVTQLQRSAADAPTAEQQAEPTARRANEAPTAPVEN